MVSSGDEPGWWAMPQRRWQRPGWDEVLSPCSWLVVVAGALLVATGDWGSLVVGSGTPLVTTISGYHRADEEAPYAERFTRPPDAGTQRLVHDAVSADRMPSEAELRGLALDCATGWARRSRRGLGLAVLVVVACCLLGGLLVRLLDQRWPESTPVRVWGSAITVVGSIGWVLNAGIPGLRRLGRLRHLRRPAQRWE